MLSFFLIMVTFLWTKYVGLFLVLFAYYPRAQASRVM